jgi:glycosyltransferase involved in cell wall biosynthesis
MTPRAPAPGNRVLFLAPEEPTLGGGGGGLRSASLLEYLRTKYTVDVVTFHLRPHSRHPAARILRNVGRLGRGVPPLFDRFSGYESQIAEQMAESYSAAVVEHFWCASYARLLRTRCDNLVLDLHNIESELARTHARAAGWPMSLVSAQFARDYAHLERSWLPEFNAVLVASEDDLRHVEHANAVVYPNALPVIARPALSTPAHAIVFTGNLEYHPNVEAVRWFRWRVWPLIREREPQLEWRLAGVNPEAIEAIVAGDARIRVLGPVEDAVATLAGAKLAVVPLLSGSGTRFKILEAWAAARAVVSTSIGAEGLGAHPGEHLLIADDAAAFAEAVVRLLNDDALATHLGEAGRQLYLDRFTWPVAWRMLEASGVL